VDPVRFDRHIIVARKWVEEIDAVLADSKAG
jgi:hypothetical protein